MTFTEHELRYLASQHLGRIATTSAARTPDVAPVGFALDDDERIVIAGLDNPRTLKWRNVSATRRAAFVVDDLRTIDPWAPRGLKIRGPAEAITDDAGRQVIRLTAEVVWSWGINPIAEKHFAGIVERRTITPSLT